MTWQWKIHVISQPYLRRSNEESQPKVKKPCSSPDVDFSRTRKTSEGQHSLYCNFWKSERRAPSVVFLSYSITVSSLRQTFDTHRTAWSLILSDLRHSWRSSHRTLHTSFFSKSISKVTQCATCLLDLRKKPFKKLSSSVRIVFECKLLAIHFRRNSFHFKLYKHLSSFMNDRHPSSGIYTHNGTLNSFSQTLV